MRPIQFILLPVLLLVLLFFAPKFRRSAILQLALVLAVFVLIVFVLVPDWSTVVANYLGIGRGVDLITYLGLLSLGTLVLILFVRVKKLEDQLVRLVRNQAMKEGIDNNRSNN